MARLSPLPARRLRATLDPARIHWETSDGIPRNGHRRPPQPRALQALELALHIRDGGYNVYLSGEPNLGRTYMLREFLAPRTRKSPTPPDLVYVNNFDDPDRPRLIELPAGQGRKLRAALIQALSRIRKEIPSRFENHAVVKKRAALLDKFQTVRSRLFKKMDDVATTQGFNLDMDDQGSLTLYPVIEGKRLSEEEFDKLDNGLRQSLKLKGDKLLQAMTGLMRQLTRAEQDFIEDERSLEREVARNVLDAVLTPVAERFAKACPGKDLPAFFAALRDDIIENLEGFVHRDAGLPHQAASGGDTPPSPFDEYRYDVNLFVDNSATTGAPIIVDDHPTPSNLLGCVERESEMGALVTDFTLIKAGSIHKANGGFLVLHMEDILQHPAAWEGLLRALRSGSARIEDPGDGQDTTKTKGIEPEPLTLRLKVVLIGTEDLYEALLESDDRFPKLFKLKAHLNDATERNAEGIRIYTHRMARIIDEAGLLPFDREAMAGLVDFGSRIIEDQRKLSLKFPLVRELMLEASAHAAMRGKKLVDRAVLDEALQGRVYRANLYEEHFMEEYDRELIKVKTDGEAVGRVNGLSVTWYGNFEFGLPHQISGTVGVGHGGIIDLEREAELGGPIHTKAMMILKSYLVDQFARNKPLVLTGSLCFEQSYAGIEGDSASGAELAALLSAISGVPIKLSLAFTGAVSQSGQIMAVGGVTRKIEGFFEVCCRRGLTGSQGVIIPQDNVDHLMLKQDIVDAVEQGRFAIYPVGHITDALELLTGLQAGRLRKNGKFTPGSLYDRVDRRLDELGRQAEHAFKKRR
ncbi:Lon protease family protein [Nitratidesulfovibrio vulgaris]|jgi:predicted ATP-dependent protease|uniref:endopeptidase La n=1 Tax=Nitratidesulfovibrio vulgaris (strain ATCC 29579 / DSM 644 / CCUG 34227 / NCIMB 8303 / VKM B-1760 / Hildenborough) TaxID=882 RepID=Q72AU7_NITV2|nr:ATP-binding protein [Nitratidesulfovibrio vulgaris]AAS96369.1 ATP-dependent protease, putative [Nitratidesulfovibrio vulgaris str. Hildenborough]ADP86569.1 ATP-dependent protease, putative [Nitratidesulfovibrio vulgaris RCH1]WCB45449.1 ATP-binding protein [Nitratidesulfovibrio vulgaris]HBW15464.1 ATP-dependent protease [Desulfovibrio sp.]